MNILLLSSGIEDYTVHYANAMSSSCDITLVVPSRLFASHRPHIRRDIDVRLMDWPRMRSVSNIALLWRLVTLIKTVKPDLVHVVTHGDAWLPLLGPLIRPIPVMTTIHDISLHPGDSASAKVPQWYRTLSARLCDGFVVHGNGLKAQLLDVLQVSEDRVFVIPLIAISKYADLAQELGLCGNDGKAPHFNVLFFGRIYEYKGLEYLVRSEPFVSDQIPFVRFVIAGRGAETSPYQALIENSGSFDIRNRFIPDEETARLFSEADLVVLPYVEASNSAVLAITTTLGKPVVVTDVGELGEIVTTSEMGIVVPSRDAKALARAIVLLAENTALREKLGRNALVYAQTIQSPKHVCDLSVRAYKHLVDLHTTG